MAKHDIITNRPPDEDHDHPAFQAGEGSYIHPAVVGKFLEALGIPFGVITEIQGDVGDLDQVTDDDRRREYIALGKILKRIQSRIEYLGEYREYHDEETARRVYAGLGTAIKGIKNIESRHKSMIEANKSDEERWDNRQPTLG